MSFIINLHFILLIIVRTSNMMVDFFFFEKEQVPVHPRAATS
jgi:hypothetical protein